MRNENVQCIFLNLMVYKLEALKIYFRFCYVN